MNNIGAVVLGPNQGNPNEVGEHRRMVGSVQNSSAPVIGEERVAGLNHHYWRNIAAVVTSTAEHPPRDGGGEYWSNPGAPRPHLPRIRQEFYSTFSLAEQSLGHGAYGQVFLARYSTRVLRSTIGTASRAEDFPDSIIPTTAGGNFPGAIIIGHVH